MSDKVITVSALNRYLKYQFDKDAQLKNILLKAEVSNFKRHSRGHLYFTLKDESSQISAVMFFENTKKLLFNPIEGSKVIIEGYVSIYEPYGTYQVYVTKMSEDGIGDLYAKYELLKKELSEKGFFDESHKKPLPKFPKTVGVVTSPTGAAVRDIIHVIQARFPLVKIILYPALVQGVESKKSIVSQISLANQQNIVDVLIVGRGGGSIEDLWSFNEEEVVRAIYASSIPIISAVGHETDFTLSDFVADKRAATPSQAAEIAVPDQKSLLVYLQTMTKKLHLSMTKDLSQSHRLLEQMRSSFVFLQPQRIFETKNMMLDYRINRLLRVSPKNKLTQYEKDLVSYEERLNVNYHNLLEQKQRYLVSVFDKLDLVNPLSLMKKGFSIIKHHDEIITSVDKIKHGDQINIELKDGFVETKVSTIKKKEN